MSSTMDLGNLLVHINGNASHFNGVIKGVVGTMKKATDTIVKYGKRAAIASAAVATLSVREYAKFDDAMTKSLSIMGDITPKVRKEMEDMARSISKQSITKATDMAEAYFFLASAGLDASQSLAALGAMEKFAVAGAFDMARATDLVTDAQSALGLTVKDAAANRTNLIRVTDVLIGANTLANASTEQFSEALTRDAGPAMKAYNISLEQGVAVLAAYADQGLKAEAAGSMFGRMIRLMVKGFADNRKTWKQFGLDIYDAQGNLRPMHDTIRDLSKVLEPMSTKTKAATLSLLGFEARSQQAILPLVGLGDKIEEYYNKLLKMQGVTDEIAEKQLKSFSAQLKIAWNNIRDVGIEIGERLAPQLLKFNKMIIENQKKIKYWGSLFANRIIYMTDILAGFVSWFQTDWFGAVGGVWDSFIQLAQAAALSIADLAFTMGELIFEGLKMGLTGKPTENLIRKVATGFYEDLLKQDAYKMNRDENWFDTQARAWQDAVDMAKTAIGDDPGKAISEHLMRGFAEDVSERFKKAMEDIEKINPKAFHIFQTAKDQMDKNDADAKALYENSMTIPDTVTDEATKEVEVETHIQNSAYQKTKKLLDELKETQSIFAPLKDTFEEGSHAFKWYQKDMEALDKKIQMVQDRMQKINETKATQGKTAGMTDEQKTMQSAIDGHKEEFSWMEKANQAKEKAIALAQQLVETMFPDDAYSQDTFMDMYKTKLEGLIDLAKSLKEYIKSPQELMTELKSQVTEAVRLGLLTTEEAAKAIFKKSQDILGTPQEGRAQQVSSYMSLSGLSMGGELSPVVLEQQKTNQILQRMERQQREADRAALN